MPDVEAAHVEAASQCKDVSSQVSGAEQHMMLRSAAAAEVACV